MTSFTIIPHQFANCTVFFYIDGKDRILKPFFEFLKNNSDNVS
jgi:hypothetical protein